MIGPKFVAWPVGKSKITAEHKRTVKSTMKVMFLGRFYV
jgi:hypothetical protein